MNRRSFADADGMTLIEIMLAVAVLGMGTVLLLGTFPSIQGTVGTSHDIARAVYHGVTVMEEISALPSQELAAYIPPAMDELGADETIAVTIVDNAGNEVPLPTDFSTIAVGVPDPVEVRVHVSWTDQSGRPKMTTVAVKKSRS